MTPLKQTDSPSAHSCHSLWHSFSFSQDVLQACRESVYRSVIRDDGSSSGSGRWQLPAQRLWLEAMCLRSNVTKCGTKSVKKVCFYVLGCGGYMRTREFTLLCVVDMQVTTGISKWELLSWGLCGPGLSCCCLGLITTFIGLPLP